MPLENAILFLIELKLILQNRRETGDLVRFRVMLLYGVSVLSNESVSRAQD